MFPSLNENAIPIMPTVKCNSLNSLAGPHLDEHQHTLRRDGQHAGPTGGTGIGGDLDDEGRLLALPHEGEQNLPVLLGEGVHDAAQFFGPIGVLSTRPAAMDSAAGAARPS